MLSSHNIVNTNGAQPDPPTRPGVGGPLSPTSPQQVYYQRSMHGGGNEPPSKIRFKCKCGTIWKMTTRIPDDLRNIDKTGSTNTIPVFTANYSELKH